MISYSVIILKQDLPIGFDTGIEYFVISIWEYGLVKDIRYGMEISRIPEFTYISSGMIFFNLFQIF